MSLFDCLKHYRISDAFIYVAMLHKNHINLKLNHPIKSDFLCKKLKLNDDFASIGVYHATKGRKGRVFSRKHSLLLYVLLMYLKWSNVFGQFFLQS